MRLLQPRPTGSAGGGLIFGRKLPCGVRQTCGKALEKFLPGSGVDDVASIAKSLCAHVKPVTDLRGFRDYERSNLISHNSTQKRFGLVRKNSNRGFSEGGAKR